MPRCRKTQRMCSSSHYVTEELALAIVRELEDENDKCADQLSNLELENVELAEQVPSVKDQVGEHRVDKELLRPD